MATNEPIGLDEECPDCLRRDICVCSLEARLMRKLNAKDEELSHERQKRIDRDKAVHRLGNALMAKDKEIEGLREACAEGRNMFLQAREADEEQSRQYIRGYEDMRQELARERAAREKAEARVKDLEEIFDSQLARMRRRAEKAEARVKELERDLAFHEKLYANGASHEHDLEQRAARAEAACAEMRELLGDLRDCDFCATPRVEHRGHKDDCPVKAALDGDAGKGWVSPEVHAEVVAERDQLRAELYDAKASAAGLRQETRHGVPVYVGEPAVVKDPDAATNSAPASSTVVDARVQALEAFAGALLPAIRLDIYADELGKSPGKVEKICLYLRRHEAVALHDALAKLDALEGEQ